MPRSSNIVIDLARVSLVYENGTRALDDVSLAVRAGQRVCVLGANGSGKSTLASVICGLLAPDSGTVTLVGEKCASSHGVDFDAYRRARRKLGLVFQNPEDQIVTSVVEDDVAFGPENLGVPTDQIRERVDRELARVAMSAYAKADPQRLSGGQRQRVTIAGALAMEPEVLVLDEPSSSLDVRGRAAILRVMRRLQDAGTAIVHVTHFMEEALEADRVIVMHRGHVALEGTPAEVFAHEHELRDLDLEEPFVAQLSAKLRSRGVIVPWTCEADVLRQALLALPRADAATITKPTTPQPTVNKPLVSVCNASFSYAQARRRRAEAAASLALDGVSLDVAAGSYTALVGQTGSGKSTLARLLCALEVPDAGTVTVDGLSTASKRDRARIHGRVGYVMQSPERQLFAQTVLEDVAWGPSNLGATADEARQRAREALALVGLDGREDASPFELSGGQQRKCAIAGVLAMRPSILVLDEPTAGLDPAGRSDLRRILESVRTQGTCVIEVTHAMEDACAADRVVVLDGGRVLLDGTPEDVFAPANEKTLSSHGLGLPASLAWARGLEAAGMPCLGSPLSLDELARGLARTLGGDA